MHWLEAGQSMKKARKNTAERWVQNCARTNGQAIRPHLGLELAVTLLLHRAVLSQQLLEHCGACTAWQRSGVGFSCMAEGSTSVAWLSLNGMADWQMGGVGIRCMAEPEWHGRGMGSCSVVCRRAEEAGSDEHGGCERALALP